MRQNTKTIAQFSNGIILALLLFATGCLSVFCNEKKQGSVGSQVSGLWNREFGLEKRSLVTTGENKYFVLKPGFQLVLEGGDTKVVITVLDETKQIGETTTRVVEEREEKNGKVVEISRNYFAFCKDTGDVFYFGEDVDIYKDGKIVSHSGAWLAGEKDAKAGMMMPGTPSPGTRYYQEVAVGIAMDRAEIVSLSETMKTSAGTFKNCLKTEETSGLNPDEKGYKTYAPGIGLIQDGDILLTKYGYVSGK